MASRVSHESPSSISSVLRPMGYLYDPGFSAGFTGRRNVGNASFKSIKKTLQYKTYMIDPNTPKPLFIELFAGLHGWGEAAAQEGYRVLGFDIVDMCVVTGKARPEGIQLVLQDVLTLHGRQFKDAAVIVASPPCQAYSYRAMPWKRAKALPPPSNDLFDACFRIQREAIAATRHCWRMDCLECGGETRYIPLVVENVRGAVKWVSQPVRWHFGSFYLWGDVPALMPIPGRAQKFNPDGTAHGQGSRFKIADSVNRGGRKVPGIKNGASTRDEKYSLTIPRRGNSRSGSRKQASAEIAKIPFPLAQHIARVYYPQKNGTPTVYV